MITLYRQNKKGLKWVPTLTPAYMFLVDQYPFLDEAEESFMLEPGPGPKEESMRHAAQVTADQLVDSAVKKDRLREKIQSYAEEEILGEVAGALDLAISPGAGLNTEQSLLSAMCARDLARYWITPSWRVQLSYRQLVQSRHWVKAIDDPSWQPIVQDICMLEDEIKRLSIKFIEEEIYPRYFTPMLELGVSTLREAGSELSSARLQNVMLVVLANAVAERIAKPIEEAYNNNPNMQRVLPDFLTQDRLAVEWTEL